MSGIPEASHYTNFCLSTIQVSEAQKQFDPPFTVARLTVNAQHFFFGHPGVFKALEDEEFAGQVRTKLIEFRAALLRSIEKTNGNLGIVLYSKTRDNDDPLARGVHYEFKVDKKYDNAALEFAIKLAGETSTSRKPVIQSKQDVLDVLEWDISCLQKTLEVYQPKGRSSEV